MLLVGSESGTWISRLVHRFGKRPLIAKVLRNSAWLSLDRVLRLLVGLFVGVWMARFLGPATFGQYSFSAALVALFGVFSRLGLDGVLVREIVRFPQARDELLGTAATLRLCGGVLAAAAATLCAVFLRPQDETVQVLTAIIALTLVFQAFDVIELWFQSQYSSRLSVMSRMGAFLSMSAVKIVLILIGARVEAFAVVAVAEIFLSGIGMAAAYRMSGQRFRRWRPSPRRAAMLLRPAAPLILAGFAVSVYMKIDQIMIAKMLGDAAVGHYSAATRLTEATYFIPTVLVTSLLPAIVSIRDSNEALFRDRMQRLFDLMSRVAVVLAIPLSLLSGWVVPFLYGDAYRASAPVLAIHAWVSVFVYLGVASSSYLLASDLTSVSFYRTAFGAVANVLLNLVLIPAFGIVGAAWATLISAAIAAFGVAVDARSRGAGLMMLRALLPFRRSVRSAGL